VARAAALLLTDPGRLSRLRQCGGATCGWLFLDETRNHSRRWCTIKDCGNLAKVRRHRAKQRQLRT
jgi:predicted RNA-binding Zn ribbon-like protein